MIDAQTRIADVVIASPATSRVLAGHRIDYCCNGNRSLGDACVDGGLDVDTVLAELRAVEAEPTHVELPPDDVGGLIGRIVAEHHAFLRRELPRLAEMAAKIVAVHGEAHPEVLDVAVRFTELANDLLPHIDEEEQVLFPMAIRLLGAIDLPSFHCGSVANPIRAMHVDHDRVGALLAELRQRTEDFVPPDEACPTWRAFYSGLSELEADTHHHVHLENNLLFPRIVDLETTLS